jgi:hypothetical protein
MNQHYVMVRAVVVWRFQKASGPPVNVNVDSTFIVYLGNGTPKIVFQHEHEDFQQLLRASGLLPAKE